MSRATTKADLIQDANQKFAELNRLIAGMSQSAKAHPFDFSQDAKKKEAHWARDKNLRDVLIHLYEWHKLLLHWVQENRADRACNFLPDPYNWRNYGEMNIAFWQAHQASRESDALQWLTQSHADVMALAEQFSSEELFQKNIFPWVGGSTLGAYFVSATASHYDWAIKKLKAHARMWG